MDCWKITDEGFHRDNIELNGSRMTIGNGFFGYRGTLEEYSAKELCALTLAGIYDDAGGWREIVNAPNPLYGELFFEGERLDVRESQVRAHVQELDMEKGLHRRRTEFETREGVRVTFESRRAAGIGRRNLLLAEYVVTSDREGQVTLALGFDKEIWECNGPHFRESSYKAEEGRLIFHGITGERASHVMVAADIAPGNQETENFSKEVLSEEIISDEKRFLKKYIFQMGACREIRLQAVVSVEKSGSEGRLKETLNQVREQTFQGEMKRIFRDHRALWDRMDIRIQGDDRAQQAVRHSLYMLLGAAPFGEEAIAIPARGLSGQVYKGAMFWDTEMYMLPMFLYEFPEVARNLVKYRVVNLQGALKKAEEYGYYGAFFPWESQESGEEGCTHYNLTDIFTRRRVRTYFRDKQIHISADVAYGLWKYYEVTGDTSILREGGARTLLECARFFCAYGYYKKDKKRYEFLDVTGADEYHERVNNNTYTNAMIGFCLEKALEALEILKEEGEDAYEEIRALPYYQESLEAIEDMRDAIFVAPPDDRGIIPQFDGFFKLEDCSLEEIRERIIDPKEYLGSPTGLCVETQISKQADVALLLTTLPEGYSHRCKRENFLYYEPRTEHGSSLSACIYALLAAQIGETDWAYRYFMKTALLDLSGDYKLYLGPLYIGGTHPAANGGTWRVLVEGFAGLKTEGNVITLNPGLPGHWEEVSFHIVIRDNIFAIKIGHGVLEVIPGEKNKEEFLLKTGCDTMKIGTGIKVESK